METLYFSIGFLCSAVLFFACILFRIWWKSGEGERDLVAVSELDTGNKLSIINVVMLNASIKKHENVQFIEVIKGHLFVVYAEGIHEDCYAPGHWTSYTMMDQEDV